jgi:dipeptidyl aminopeptidase/acylaminoacyl peptidase
MYRLGERLFGHARSFSTVTDQTRLAAILHNISPVSFVTPDDPPTLLIHGDADQTVPFQQSRRLIERLKSANVDAQLVIRQGMRHAYSGWEDDSELIAKWFDSHLHPGNSQ